jgi:hypothetical protein
MMPSLGTASNEPVTISRARSGYLRAILPISETCRNCTVPERTDVLTAMLEPLPNTSSLAVSFSSGQAWRTAAGSAW